jgi:IclR family KDG regulon transcriptional repressor
VNSSIERALMMLEYVADKKVGVTLAELVKEMDIPKSTAHRILETLKTREYLEMDPVTERVSIGMKALEVGFAGLTNMEIIDVARHYLRELAATTGETTFLALLNEGEIVYLYKVEGTQSIRTSAQLGSRRPVHCTGLGKAILSGYAPEEVDRILADKGMAKFTDRTITESRLFHEELSRIRLQGYSADDEEMELGVACFAVPVFNYTGQVVGAISVAGPKDRILEQQVTNIARIREAGSQISRRLGFVASMRNNF